MKGLGRGVIISMGAWILTAGGLGAQTDVLVPDWSSVATAKNLQNAQNLEPPDEIAVRNSTGNRDPLTRYRLPMLGFTKSIFDPSKAANILGRDISTQNDALLQNPWPPCASLSSDAQIAGDDQGEWYSLVYDFGCVTVTVDGERRTRRVNTLDEAELVDSSRGEQMFVLDENDDGKHPTRAEYTFTRFGLPYSITIECTEEAGGFCGDKDAQNLVLARIDIIGGSP